MLSLNEIRARAAKFADYRDLKPHINPDYGIDFSKYYNNFKSLIK